MTEGKLHLDCASFAPSNHGSTPCGLHWEDYLQGFGIPAVISTSRLVPARTYSLRPRAKPGLTTWAAGGTTITESQPQAPRPWAAGAAGAAGPGAGYPIRDHDGFGHDPGSPNLRGDGHCDCSSTLSAGPAAGLSLSLGRVRRGRRRRDSRVRRGRRRPGLPGQGPGAC